MQSSPASSPSRSPPRNKQYENRQQQQQQPVPVRMEARANLDAIQPLKLDGLKTPSDLQSALFVALEDLVHWLDQLDTALSGVQ